MIPKTIHYCWFGGKPLDQMGMKCLDSWKRYFPDYDIICWNEKNFDVGQISFMKEAYEHKKWAFVSDVARLIIIYEYGGIYFDTDVEVVSSYHDILTDAKTGFLGFETTNYVATGLGFGAEKGNQFLLDVINEYKKMSFSDCLANLDKIACPIVMTNLMQKQGYRIANICQNFRGFKVFSSEYFSPLDYETGRIKRTKNTHSIHWGNASWNDQISRQERPIMQKYKRIFGKKIGDLLFGVYSSIKREGFVNYVKRHFKCNVQKKNNRFYSDV